MAKKKKTTRLQELAALKGLSTPAGLRDLGEVEERLARINVLLEDIAASLRLMAVESGAEK